MLTRSQWCVAIVLTLAGCSSSQRVDRHYAPQRTAHEPQPKSGVQATAAAAKAGLIRVREPEWRASVQSPLRIAGEARGYWFFEAAFPLKLLDAHGEPIAHSYAQAQGEWMTEDFVPFVAELPFAAPTTPTGTLVLEKQNASGLPEHADELRIPVCFHECSGT
jgi:hypothetical protein